MANVQKSVNDVMAGGFCEKVKNGQLVLKINN